MAQRIQFRRDTAANWTSVNPILSQGELGLELDTMTYKIGNGVLTWNALPYGGVAGAGVAPGGTVGQFLQKNSAVNYDTSWATLVVASISDLTITAAQLNSLASGANSALHFHDSDRARTNHTGTQSAATITGLATVATSGLYSDLTGTPSALPPSGAAGGDFSGTFPNPTLSAAKESFLLSRTNHTGTQAASTITGLAAVATSGLASDVGLGSVDNTSDVNKPVSTAQAAADSAVQAFSIQRANHMGTQLAVTISDFSSAADARITAQKALPNGLASLDATGKLTATQIPSFLIGAANYQGTWDASSNSPALASSVGTKGYYYVVQVAGSTNLDGTTSWNLGDWVIFNGTIWQKVDNTDAVLSVNGLIGAVILTSDNISEGVTNLYFTAARAQSAAVQNSLAASTVIAPSATAVNTGLALKAALATANVFTSSNTFTGDGAGTGYAEFTPQSASPSTPATGFKLFATSTGKLAWKGTNGFLRTFDGSANTADRVYTLPDQDATLMNNPMTTNGDLITRSAGIPSRVGIGTDQQLLRVVGGVPTWGDENLGQDFGDGSDGTVVVSGPVTLTQATYYNSLTIVAGGSITTNGYPLYCKTLDLSNAPVGAIKWNGNPGLGTQINANGGAGGAALTANILGGAGAGGAGGAGGAVVTAGTLAAATTAATPSNGGPSGAGGAGGTGAGAAGAASRAGAAVSNNVEFGRFEVLFLRGGTLVVGGSPGPGGSGGGGDTVTNTGRGGGGGGSGGGVVAIYAETLITSASTAAGAIQSIGGAGGGNTTTALGGGGAGGGGGGGGGGYVYLAYNTKVGATVTNLIQATGGLGGNGGNSTTGGGGSGGTGGQGGRILVYNAVATTGLHVVGSAGTAGSGPVGTAGGAGGSGGNCSASV